MTTNPPRDDAPETIWILPAHHDGQRGWPAQITTPDFYGAVEYRRADTPARAGTWTPTHRHVKRGTEYQEMARGMLQTDVPLSDYAELVAYRGNDGEWWFRPPSEFDDGRFAAMSQPEPDPVAWQGPGEKPHRYSPDLMAGGDDCRHCGHGWDAHQPATPPAAPTDTALVEAAHRFEKALRYSIQLNRHDPTQISRPHDFVTTGDFHALAAALASRAAPPEAQVTVAEAARVLLDQMDNIWSSDMSTATDNARQKAKRDGHKYRVIDREGFRAALRALAGEGEA
ncbi:hypothetical protein ACHFJ0_04775 [Paracoccus sp. NGMCC 1.201697]|uniref:Uncharacterized protein n=1 Tax=Paracoccus broussonetiae subsp. drimophilus TaxID=3373869 RepID=A0ABW7LGS3_9RHOB